jgi:hypothetical protein
MRPRHVFDPHVADAMEHGRAHDFVVKGLVSSRGGMSVAVMMDLYAHRSSRRTSGTVMWGTGGCEGGHTAPCCWREERDAGDLRVGERGPEIAHGLRQRVAVEH